MTYFGFLARFLLMPILLLAGLAWLDWRRGLSLPPYLRGGRAAGVLAVLVLVAVVYTTPWDNYLVATGVWWYDPALVTGVVFGWVPIEEYTFFILETLLAGLWTLALARRLPEKERSGRTRSRLRWLAPAALAPFWAWSVGVLAQGWQPGAYLALLLVWSLPPIALQLAFGADLLWKERRLVLPAILVPAAYLSLADSLALGAGTWTINPEQSLHLLVGGVLPVEEIIFFFLTNTLVVFGLSLALSVEARARLDAKREAAGAYLQSFSRNGLGMRTTDPGKSRQAEE